MAAVSHTATTSTSSTHAWGNGLPTELEDEQTLANDQDIYPAGRPALATHNGNTGVHDTHSRRYSNGEASASVRAKAVEATYHPQQNHKDPKAKSVKDHAGLAESLLDPQANGKDRNEPSHRKAPGDLPADSDSDENSKWIHRDKLARIENEELQAAGIFLPRQRDRARSKSQNRPRRDQSQDKINGSARSIGGADQASLRSRKNSAATYVEPRTPEISSIPSWDLRRPEEILEEGDGYWVSSSGGKGSSRIPVAKVSPVPIPTEHLARDTPLTRKRDASLSEEDTITYPKTRQRSSSTGNALAKSTSNGHVSQQSSGTTSQPAKRTDSSPKKTTPGSGTKRPKPANGAAGRPKTRGGPSKDSTSSGTGTRPSTRSGERELSISSRPMEGEPPWMVSAYRPDPRLPPDQQLLPTVAKRLQQEKWEREGKFGNVYDKEFRPLTDEGFLRPPEPDAVPKPEAEKEPQAEEHADWPLKPDTKPTLPGRTNSYSTMPKIVDKPTDPLPSPRSPAPQPQPTPVLRVPVPPEDSPAKKKGCGCCIVM